MVRKYILVVVRSFSTIPSWTSFLVSGLIVDSGLVAVWRIFLLVVDRKGVAASIVDLAVVTIQRWQRKLKSVRIFARINFLLLQERAITFKACLIVGPMAKS